MLDYVTFDPLFLCILNSNPSVQHPVIFLAHLTKILIVMLTS